MQSFEEAYDFLSPRDLTNMRGIKPDVYSTFININVFPDDYRLLLSLEPRGINVEEDILSYPEHYSALNDLLPDGVYLVYNEVHDVAYIETPTEIPALKPHMSLRWDGTFFREPTYEDKRLTLLLAAWAWAEGYADG